jgi:hypothetical protein
MATDIALQEIIGTITGASAFEFIVVDIADGQLRMQQCNGEPENFDKVIERIRRRVRSAAVGLAVWDISFAPTFDAAIKAWVEWRRKKRQ